MKRNRKGFTLIELLIVVAIIGIIVAIAIPNLLNAIQRAKQKRTMGDMRTIGTAAEAYAVDYNFYPAAAGAYSTSVSTPGTPVGSLSAKLTPTYIRILPLTDGWDSTLEYGTDTNHQAYCLQSSGRDGIQQTAPPGGATTDFNSDIVFCQGQFTQFPEGVQK